MRIAVRVDAYGQSDITVTGGVANSVVRCGTKSSSGIENFAPVDVRLDQSGTGTCPRIKVYEGSTVIVRSSDGTLAGEASLPPGAAAAPLPTPPSKVPQDLTFTGSISGHISSALGSCTETGNSIPDVVYIINIDERDGVIGGKRLSLQLQIPGPDAPAGRSLGFVNLTGEGAGYHAFGGRGFTVEPDGQSGTVDMDLVGDGVLGGALAHVSGSWRCIRYGAAPPSSATPPPAPTPSAVLSTPAPPAAPFVRMSVTSPVARGSSAAVTVATLPGAHCMIFVAHASGSGSGVSAGLVVLPPKTADANGVASWSWIVGTTETTLGPWSIDVTCAGVSARAFFSVQ
jgi:hypothetical protein